MDVRRLNRGAALFIAWMATCSGATSGEDIPLPVPAKRVVMVRGQGIALRTIRVAVNGVPLDYREFAETGETNAIDPESEFDNVQDERPFGERQLESKVDLEDNTLDWIVFGSLTFDVAERRCHEVLCLQLEYCDQIVRLDDLQRRKLDLAGRGDIARLFTRFRQHKAKFTKLAAGLESFQAFTNWTTQLRTESVILQKQWISATWSADSLFIKTLATMATPEQLAEFRQRQSISRRPSQPAVPVKLAAIQEREPPAKPLDAILQEWEQATAKIQRVDCTFQRFKYDATFEIEKRATGSLAVDQHGRAVYRIAPVMIKPGERSRKKGKEGELYDLKSDSPERWHWTGRSLVLVDETARTFYETVFPVAPLAAQEFRPDPPALPQEDEPRETSNAVVAIIWNVNGAFADGPRELPFARPFLLGMSAETLKERFQINVQKQTDTEVWLRFIPLQKADAVNIEKAVLILETPKYLPIALQLTDPTGSQTVHIFKDVKINHLPERWDALDNLEQPDLRGMRQAIEVKSEAND